MEDWSQDGLAAAVDTVVERLSHDPRKPFVSAAVTRSKSELTLEVDCPLPFGPVLLVRRPPEYGIRPETLNAAKEAAEAVTTPTPKPATGGEGGSAPSSVVVVNDPFRPYDKDQYLGRVPGTTDLLAVVNRFSVEEPLALLVFPEAFVSNFELLDESNFRDLASMLSLPCFSDALVLKNCGAAGSQVHFHLNVFPTSGRFKVDLPYLEPFSRQVSDDVEAGKPLGVGCRSDLIGASHCLIPIPETAHADADTLSATLFKAYRDALAGLELGTLESTVPVLPPMKVTCALSALDPTAEDEVHEVSFDVPCRPHKLYIHRTWLLVIGPLTDISAFGDPFGSKVDCSFAFLGKLQHTAWKLPREAAQEQVSVLNGKPVRELTREAWLPGSVSGK